LDKHGGTIYSLYQPIKMIDISRIGYRCLLSYDNIK